MMKKFCVICKKSIIESPMRHGIPLCNSIECESTLREHLGQNLSCCSVCGVPVNIPNATPRKLAICSSNHCHHKSSSMRGSDSVFCRLCGIHLPNQFQDGVNDLCNSSFCQTWDARYASIRRVREQAIAEEKRRQEMAEVALQRTIALRPNFQKEPSLQIVVLPFLDHNLVRPSKERLERVEAGLLELARIAQSMNDAEASSISSKALEADSEPKTILPSTFDEGELRFSKLNGVACATCGGRCCNLGGDRAFLTVDKFREVLRARRHSCPEMIVKEYMDQIPAEVFVDSCIFHGIKGCVLARENRSITCNTWLCSSLRDLQDGLSEDTSTFLFASTNFREIDDSEFKVYRIKIATDVSAESILADVTDRP